MLDWRLATPVANKQSRPTVDPAQLVRLLGRVVSGFSRTLVPILRTVIGICLLLRRSCASIAPWLRNLRRR